jgi:hypothetical protein
MAECELLESCGFFKKYMLSLEMECRGFMKTYCNGDMMNECERKKFRDIHGCPPDDDMLPTGEMMPESLE